MCKEVEIYTIYKCPICETRYLSKQEAEKCLEKCQKTYHKVFQIKLTLDINTNTFNGECTITEKEIYLTEQEFNVEINKVRSFYHYDKVDFMAYSKSNDPNANEETINRIKKFIVAWFERRIEFVKNYLGEIK